MDGLVRCSKGHENKQGAKFCQFCAEPLRGGQVKCQRCGYMNDSIANFCGSCGAPLKGDTASTIKGMVWQRNTEDFATRVDTDDLPGLLQKGLIVEQGTRALLFINGAYAETLTPGMYDMGGLLSKLKRFDPYRSCTAILIDAGDAEFKFTISGVFTNDPLGIDVTCTFVLQVDNPINFFNNLMKGKGNYPINELRKSLYDELHNAFNEQLGKKSVKDLNWDLSLKRQLEVNVENHLMTTFQRNGFKLIQLRTIDYKFGRFDAVRGINEETFLMVSESEAKLSGRRRLFDVYNDNQLQDIFEDTRKNELFRKRAEVKIDQIKAEAEEKIGLKGANADARISEGELDVNIHKRMTGVKIDQAKAEAAEKIGLKGVGADTEISEWELASRTRRQIKEHLLDKSKTDEEIEKHLLEIEKGKMLRAEEIADLKRTLNEKNVDHDIRRQQMIKKLELEQTLELRRMETIGEADLKMLDLDRELGFESKRLLGKEGLEKEILILQLQKSEIKLNAELQELEKTASAQREQRLADAMQKLQLDLEQAKTDAEKARIQIDLKKAEQELENQKDKDAIALLEAVKRVKRDDEYSRMKMEIERKEKELQWKLTELREINAQEIAKIDAQSKAELARIDKLSNASAEYLMSISGPEQAKMIAGLKETEAMKGLSADEILAMAAAKSPEVAKAFQEKYRGMAREEQERFYKMVIEEKDKAREDMNKQLGEFMAKSEREHIKSLETAKEIAIGVAQAGRPNGPQVVYPPQGQTAGYYQAGAGIGAAGIVICPKCKTQVVPEPGKRFCPNCAEAIF